MFIDVCNEIHYLMYRGTSSSTTLCCHYSCNDICRSTLVSTTDLSFLYLLWIQCDIGKLTFSLYESLYVS